LTKKKIHTILTILEKLPEFHITFFSKNQNFIRMITIDSIQNPFNVISTFSEFFQKRIQSVQNILKRGMLK